MIGYRARDANGVEWTGVVPGGDRMSDDEILSVVRADVVNKGGAGPASGVDVRWWTVRGSRRDSGSADSWAIDRGRGSEFDMFGERL